MRGLITRLGHAVPMLTCEVDTVSEVLQFVDYSPSDMLGCMRNNVEKALRQKLMTIDESRTLISRFRTGMIG